MTVCCQEPFLMDFKAGPVHVTDQLIDISTNSGPSYDFATNVACRKGNI